MAHNLEINGNEVAFALRGTPAWHNLANRIFNQDEDVSTQLMLDEAKLSNWDVRLSPVTDFIPEDWNDTSDAQLVIRTNPFNGGTDVLSTVGSRYKVVQMKNYFHSLTISLTAILAVLGNLLVLSRMVKLYSVLLLFPVKWY